MDRDVSQLSRTKERRTVNGTVPGHNGNTGIVSITAECIAPVGKKNGNLTNVKETEEEDEEEDEKKKKKKKKKTTKKKTIMHKHPVQRSSPPADNAQERNRSRCGGRADRNVTGDRTKKKETERDTHRDVQRSTRSPHTGRETTESDSTDREGCEGIQGRRSTKTRACGGGRRIAEERGEDRCWDVPQTRTTRSTNTGSGRCTSQDLNSNNNTAMVQPVDLQPRSGIGSNFRVTFLTIMSKLFPLDIKAECSASSTATAAPEAHDGGSPRSSSLDEIMVTVAALEENFEELANWFKSFERTKARTVIGFDLAMEVCGCYDIILCRLGKALRDTFGDRVFIKSPQEVTRADKALKVIADRLRGDTDHALNKCLADASKLFDDGAQAEFHSLQNTVKTFYDGMTLSSSVDIQTSLEAQWSILLDVVRAVIRIAGSYNSRIMECTAELTAVRADNSALRSECEDAKGTRLSLEDKHRSLTAQMSNMSAVQEDAMIKDKKNEGDIAELRELLRRAQKDRDDASRHTETIVSAHAADKRRWEKQLFKLQMQLEETNGTIKSMTDANTKAKVVLEQRIAELTASEEDLMGVVSRLRESNALDCAEYEKKLREAELQDTDRENTIFLQNNRIRELVQTDTKHTQRYDALHKECVSLHEDVDTLNEIKVKLSLQNRALRGLSQFLGVDKLQGGECPIHAIRLLRDASVERISKVLRDTCIRVGKGETHGDMEDKKGEEEEEEEMDTNKGDMFIEYESQIANVIKTLPSDSIPMEVTNVRVIRTPVKRKLVTISTFQPRQKLDIRSEVKRKLKLEGPPGYVSEEDGICAETKLEPNHTETKDSTKATLQWNEVMPSVRERLMSEDSEVCTFGIAECSENARVTVSIPTYITANLSGDVKLVDLGLRIDTLLDVLQVDDGTKTSCIITAKNTCHCSQMKSIAQRLQCTLVIYWAPTGGHEVYGRLREPTRLYAIVYEYKHQSYYLLSVQHNGSYMYNLAKLPSSSQIELPQDGFVHKTDGTCQGPSPELSSRSNLPTMHSVDSIKTCYIVLHGNV